MRRPSSCWHLARRLLFPPNDSQLTDKQFVAKNLSETLIPVSQVPLFANLSEYNLTPRPPVTRAGEVDAESDESVPLEELLDRDGTISCPFEDQFFIQVPFLQNKENLLAGISEEEVPDLASATVVKKFYMEMHADDLRLRYVVTMVTGAAYYRENPEFDYLDKPNYTGVVLLSSIQGKLIDATMYSDGLIRNAQLLTPEELASGKHDDLQFITLYKQIPSTRSLQEIQTLDEAAYCVASREDSFDRWWREMMDYFESDDGGGLIWTGDGSNGGGNGNYRSDEGGLDTHRDPDPRYTVSLSTNHPEMINVEGGGTYPKGTRVSITCSMIVPYWHPDLHAVFDRWTGDLEEYDDYEVQLRVSKNITSTAYFEDIAPCKDAERGVMNPLREMSVAPSGGWNYKGGTFGYTRESGTKKHEGLDLEATPGTPLYAMYPGTIVSMETDAPNYNVKRSYGNQIVVESEIDGETLYFMYAHLNYGNPVAYNYRESRDFAVGDSVYVGDLIGYTGKTGNAFDDDVPNKHLHLGINTGIDMSSAGWVDPAPYINGTIDVGSIQRDQGAITEIHCD